MTHPHFSAHHEQDTNSFQAMLSDRDAEAGVGVEDGATVVDGNIDDMLVDQLIDRDEIGNEAGNETHMGHQALAEHGHNIGAEGSGNSIGNASTTIYNILERERQESHVHGDGMTMAAARAAQDIIPRIGIELQMEIDMDGAGSNGT